MVSISKIETGLAKFIDSELIDKLELNGWKRLVTASVSSIFIKKLSNILSKLQKNSFVEMLELFDENGDVDLDLVYSEIKANMPESGIKIEIPGISIGVTLKNNDIDTLYKYMIEYEITIWKSIPNLCLRTFKKNLMALTNIMNSVRK